jgi:hypothetical protein
MQKFFTIKSYNLNLNLSNLPNQTLAFLNSHCKGTRYSEVTWHKYQRM